MYKTKLKRHIPNVLTVLNMLLGLSCVMLLFGTNLAGREQAAAALILIGGVIDAFDGYLARKFNAVTDLGKQLDSFADLVTFGIAPLYLVHQMSLCDYSVLAAFITCVYPIAGAFRLARYNLSDSTSHFTGLPITAAGMLLAIFCLVHIHWVTYQHPAAKTAVTVIFVIILSTMMVSKIKVKRFPLLGAGI